MRDDLGENFMYYVQRLLPLISSLVLVLLAYIPMDILPFNDIRPAVAFVCIYYWLIHRSDLFNLISVYILGFVEDVMSNVPFGVNIFVVLVFFVVVSNMSRFFNGKPFVVTWYGFALLSLIAFLTKWLVMSIYYGQFLPLSMVLFSFLTTVAAYPFLSLVLAFVQNNLIADEE